MVLPLPQDMMNEFYQKRLITSQKTKYTYNAHLRRYFEAIDVTDIRNYVKKPAKEIEPDLSKAYMKINDMPPYTQLNIFTIVRTFISIWNKDIKELDFWTTLRRKLRNAHMASEELVPDAEELKRFLEYGNVKEKAMFLTLASCGCSLLELVNIELDDIHLDEEPTRIYLRRTKNGKPRTTFITPEATRAVKDWLKQRDNYLDLAVRRNTPNKPGAKTLCNKVRDDTRLFPLNDDTARKIWHKLARKAGMNQKDKTTGRLIFHPHCLRKYFRTYFGNADLAELLMGHEGYLSTYRNMNDKQLAKEYEKHMDNIMVFDRSPDLEEVNAEIKELKEEREDMKRRMERMEDLMQQKEAMLKMIENRLEIEKIKNGNNKN